MKRNFFSLNVVTGTRTCPEEGGLISFQSSWVTLVSSVKKAGLLTHDKNIDIEGTRIDRMKEDGKAVTSWRIFKHMSNASLSDFS